MRLANCVKSKTETVVSKIVKKFEEFGHVRGCPEITKNIFGSMFCINSYKAKKKDEGKSDI